MAISFSKTPFGYFQAHQADRDGTGDYTRRVIWYGGWSLTFIGQKGTQVKI